MSKYAELDTSILSSINNTAPTLFHRIHLGGGFCGDVFVICESLASKRGEGFRVLDRRLQALRKAGKIKSVPGKGWIKLNEGDK